MRGAAIYLVFTQAAMKCVPSNEQVVFRPCLYTVLSFPHVGHALNMSYSIMCLSMRNLHVLLHSLFHAGLDLGFSNAFTPFIPYCVIVLIGFIAQTNQLFDFVDLGAATYVVESIRKVKDVTYIRNLFLLILNS